MTQINKVDISVENAVTKYQKAEVLPKRIWDDKMYLYPIPENETFINPNLGQNTVITSYSIHYTKLYEDSYKMVKPVGNDLDAYRNAFASGYLDRNNGEIIFPIQNQDIWGLGQRYFASTRFGALAPSLEFVNKFERIV